MVQPIGTSSGVGNFSPIGNISSAAALEFQLAKYTKELSSCINCESAKTSQGKRLIQELTVKIRAVEARIGEFERTSRANIREHATAFNEPSSLKTAEQLKRPNRLLDVYV